jgi:NADPH2:quinone reductase
MVVDKVPSLVSVDEELLYPLPDGVNEQEAVAVVHSALTACLGLIREAGLKAGETLFINGGSGNVGSAVLQVARHLGARVIATAGSTEKLRRGLELGADRAVNYKTEDVAATIRDFAPQAWMFTGTPRASPISSGLCRCSSIGAGSS